MPTAIADKAVKEVNYGKIICHYCGFTPPELPRDRRCPKCRHHSWERTNLENYLQKVIETLAE